MMICVAQMVDNMAESTGTSLVHGDRHLLTGGFLSEEKTELFDPVVFT
jgi:hypothetical protein